MVPPLNEFPMPTFGSTVGWEEVGRAGEYVIQRNRVSGHHRLLDGANVRRAWGNFETCEEVLGRLISQPDQPMNPNVVIPTLGGMQFWSDEVVRCGWRVQRNVFTRHCRAARFRRLPPSLGHAESMRGGDAAAARGSGDRTASENVVVLYTAFWAGRTVGL